MKDELKEFLSFSKAERRGVFILSFIVLIILLYNIFIPSLNIKAKDFSAFETQVKYYELKKDSISRLLIRHSEINRKTYKKVKRTYHPKNFDPNIISKKAWVDMGLTPKQASSIIKFIAKGGKFYEPEDLHKLYCLSSKECDLLIPYVIIQENNFIDDFTLDENDYDYLHIELNTATIDNLKLVKGIGPATAKGIINYRKLLGGYCSVNQLKEVFLIDSLKFESIKNNFFVNNDSIKYIDINTADYYKLYWHPYITKRLAYEIVQYRSQRGDFKKVSDLLKVKGMSDSIYQKIYLYFALSETHTQ